MNKNYSLSLPLKELLTEIFQEEGKLFQKKDIRKNGEQRDEYKENGAL